MSLKVSTFIDLLQYRASKTPDRTAFIFLEEGESETARITYAELHQRARAIGAWLQLHKATGERVLLLYPSGLDYIASLFGCMYAGAIAVPAYPPRHNRTLDRLEGIIHDAQPAFALTNKDIHARMESLDGESTNLRRMKIVDTDRIDKSFAEFWFHPFLSERSLAFLQYTSGSTATPKGVMLSHANLLFNERLIQKIFQQTEKSIVVGWLPLYHDMGLIGSVLQPIYNGSSCILMPPTAFLQQPIRWLQTISRYQATTSGGPNFAYELCVRKIDEEQRAALDLSTWTVAFNGAEPIRVESIEHFVRAFGAYGFSAKAFRPCYGLAEATLIVSGQKKPGPPLVKRVEAEALTYDRVVQATDATSQARPLIGCGHALGQELIIVNPETLTRCAASRVGEIWVSGRGVAQGYWNNQGETKAVFRAYLANGDGPYLRTGDLGFKHKNELFITGRLKDLIIIRGVNHYPQDIEHTVQRAHENLMNHRGAAFSMEVDGEEQLAVVHEIRPRRQTDFDELVRAIRHAVAREHGVNVYTVALVKPGAVPVTTSGKIQRRACRQALLGNSLELLKVWQQSASEIDEVSLLAGPPWDATAIQSWLQSQIASRLRIRAGEVSTDRPLAEYGLDSLAAVEIKHSIEKVLGVQLPLTSLLHETTVRDLAAQAIARLANDGLAGLALTHADESIADAPLSQGQRSLWFMQQLAPDSTAYSIVSALRIVSDVDAAALRRAFQLLTDRHAILRTNFSVVAGEPVQHVSARADVCFEQIDASAWSATEVDRYLDAEVHRPFNLETGSLLRIKLLKRAAREHVLLIAAHHIIADLWSLALLLQEFGDAYKAEVSGEPNSLPSLSFNYTDYVRWQEHMLASAEGDRLWSYWRQQLAGELPVLELPTDRPRPLVQTYRGASLSFEVDAALTQQLKQLGQANGATLYMTLLAAFQVLLHRYTNQEQFAIGSSTAGRSLAGLARVVGYFVNPVVVRADLSGTPAFETLLGQVCETVLSAFEHQDYPFASLVERLQPVRDPRVSPLFQTMFVLQKAPVLNEEGMSALALGRAGARMEVGGLTLEYLALDQRIAQFDLTLSATEVGGALVASLQYNTDLFEATTVARLAANFKVLLEGIVTDPSRSITALPIVSEAEQRQLLIDWNDTQTSLVRAGNVVQLFEQQARERRDVVALSFGDTQLTYGELENRANRLARYLVGLGVSHETRVGLLLERSLEMVVGLFGVLKAGAAYVPLDPSYPQQRIDYVLRDAGISVLLTQQRLESDWAEIDRQSCEPLLNKVSGENLAYIIYTSGSTGGPKGVMIHHAGLSNYLHWARQTYTPSEGFAVPVQSSLSFDLTVTSLLLPLVSGQPVVLLPEVDGAGALGQAIETETDWSLVKLTPANLEMLSHQLPAAKADGRVRTFVVGGEALRWEQLRFWQTHASRTRIINEYGPTETVVGCCVYEAGPDEFPRESGVPIGRPVANTCLYVLNHELQPAPIGVSGELGISSAGVARGYLDRPELTAAVFVPDPFSTDPGRRLYRTGDLVRYRSDSVLEYLGRNDQQVKIRGFRIELGEIESVLARHDAVRAVVIGVYEEHDHERSLVAYIVPAEREPTDEELRRYLQKELPAYMVPSAFVVLSELPVTRNGKIDRAALPAPVLSREATKDFTEPRTPVEEVLVAVWCEVLGRETIGVDDNFFDAGGHSLLAAKVVSRIRDTLGIEIPLRAVFESPTIAQLAERVESAGKTEAPPIQSTGATASVLSYAQQRLWFLDQMQPGLAIYNIPAAIRLSGSLNVAALEAALREIVRRHEVLRARFINVDGEPQQVIAAVENFTPALVDGDGSDSAVLIEAEAHHPFDLSHGPVRATLLRESDESFVLLLTVHHIASDGWSGDVFIREIAALYRAYEAGEPSPLTELPVQYGDYAVWQRDWLSGPVLQEQIDYWKEQLALAPTVLELPTDRVRSGVQSYRGGSEQVELSSELRARLEELSRREGVTLFMTLLAAWKVLLHRYTNQEQVVVGTPIAGRTRGEVEGLIGFFANTLVLRTELSGELSFRELLKRVREVCLGAYSNQDLPFEKLVEVQQPERTLSHNPLFQVFFNMFSVATQQLKLQGVTSELLRPAELGAKFDLTIDVEKTEAGLKCTAEYNADLFERARVGRMLEHFEILLHGVVANLDQPISRLPLLSEPEQFELSAARHASQRDFNLDECVHELFERQVQESPESVAVSFGDAQLTYRELNERSNQLARHLQSLGVGAESLVALALDRSLEMVIGLFGVLKAGAAYLPLDPDYPQSRLSYMMEDAQAHVVLTQAHLLERTALGHQAVCLDRDWELIAQHEKTNLNTTVDAAQLAYIIYTSGSTGGPKGVMVTHGSLTNLLHSVREQPAITASDRILQVSTLSFDIAAPEIYLPLMVGARVELVSRDELLSPVKLLQRLEQSTVMQATPSLWRMLVESGDWNGHGEYRLLSAGEALSRQLVQQLAERSGAVWNLYGPTETTIYSTLEQVFGEGEEPYESIGRAVANTQLHILDRWLQPVPTGVSGELYIAGAGVARGYLRRPELTAERFIPNRFSEMPGARCYNSGDLARFLAEGRVEYLGRADHQVKVRGHRIELREIESALAQHDQVRAAAVVARTVENGEKQLVAYVVADDEATTMQLRSYLKERMPDYMLPSFFMTLDEMPLTANGKVDRRQLLELAREASPQQSVKEYVAPRTATQEVLTDLWTEVLGVERVGINDDFFALGGHSLLATQLLSRVQKIFRVDLPLRKLFETPTVLGLADALALAYGDADAIEDIAQMVKQLREMSDEDLKQMMAAV